MKIRSFLNQTSLVFVMSSVLVTLAGCPDKDSSGGSPSPSPPRNPLHCAQFEAKEDECKKDNTCTWDDKKTPKCQDADASISGKCAGYQEQTACNKNTACDWDSAATPPVCKDKVAPTLSFLEATFDPNAIATAKGQTGATSDISAIGKNGNGSRLYYGVMTDKKYLSILDPTNLATAAVHVETREVTTGDDSQGKAKFSHHGDNTVISNIVAGPGNVAIASVTGVDTYLGGILEINDNRIVGAWRSSKAHLATAAGRKEILNIQVMGNQWMAFVDENATTGAHREFGAALGVATAGPKNGGGNLGIKILASAVKGDDLFLAHVDVGGPVVTRSAVAKVGPTYTLTGDVDVDPAHSIIGRAQMNVAGGPNNNDRVSAMAVVGDNLLIGFDGTGGAGTGGLAIYDTVGNALVSAPIHDEWSVKHIGVSVDGTHAIISTDKGLLIYVDGKLIKIQHGVAADVTNLTLANANANQPLVSNALPGAMALNHTKIGAVNIGNTWFIATNNAGIFKMTVARKTKNL